MLLRNDDVRRATVASLGAAVVFAALAWLVAGPAAALICLLGAGAVAAIFLRLTAVRHKRIAEMSRRVDMALHEGRAVSLSDMREGELAILVSEVDKALGRLTITSERLAREKTTLADSLADISHQLRTPLTSLGLTLDLARKEARAADSSKVLARLRQSERLLAQVQRLVEALLKLARIDAGTVRLARETVDVASLVREAAAPLVIPYDLADVTLETSVEPGCSFVGDRAWTCEALENVLKNCLEHTPAGGRVVASATRDALACRISVTDTGPGISEVDLPHVFERFYRGVDERPDEAGLAGVGIGLSLAQSLISAQDGRITAGNVTDGDGRVTGARFDILFFRVTV